VAVPNEQPDEHGAAEDHAFSEELGATQPQETPLALGDLGDVRMVVSADIGSATMEVREILNLKRGSVIPLDKMAGAMADIEVNGVPLAKGEIVVLGDNLHIRIVEIHGTTDSDISYE